MIDDGDHCECDERLSLEIEKWSYSLGIENLNVSDWDIRLVNFYQGALDVIDVIYADVIDSDLRIGDGRDKVELILDDSSIRDCHWSSNRLDLRVISVLIAGSFMSN